MSNFQKLIICFLFFLLGGILWHYFNSTAEKAPLDKVILITIDTLRADHLGSYGYIRNTSPFFDEMAQKGILFEKHVASMSTTAPSHASLFTSLYPLQHQVMKNGHLLADEYTTMAESFRDSGFTTAGFVSTLGHFKAGNFDQGFDYFNEPDLSEIDLSIGPHGKRYRPAEETIQKTIEWLEKMKKNDKFFLWIHLFDPHLPLDPPENHRKAMVNTLDREILMTFWTEKRYIPQDFFANSEQMYQKITLYDAEIHYADRQLQRLFNFYQEKQFDHNSLWIITADHGEGLGNHYWWEHGKHVYNEQLHIPLVFYFSSGFGKNQKVPALVENIDIFPTLLELLNKNNSRLNLQGKSFLSLLKLKKQNKEFKRYAFSQRRLFERPAPEIIVPAKTNYEEGETYALQSLRYKYIHRTEGLDEFYSLVDDPYEVNSLINQGLLEEQIFHQELLNIVANLKKESSDDYIMVDEEALEQLRSLGYAQ